jgi:hypothetical protein
MLMMGAALTLFAQGDGPPARAGAAELEEIEGVGFAGSVVAEDTPLELHSVGVLRWYFLKGYVAGLYLGPEVAPEDVLADTPKRLELHYLYGIRGEDFGEAAWKLLARSLDRPALERIRARADHLASAYEDVEPGDRYALTYLPGVGTRLSLNGETRATIPGADFAAAYFGIWLGDEPLDEPLRDQLLTPGRAELH